MSRASRRVDSYGLTTAQIAMPPWRTISLATKAMRRMFVSRSSLLNPRPFDRWVRTTSPSSSVMLRPRRSSRAASSVAMVDLPAPLRPVSQTQQPRGASARMRQRYAHVGRRTDEIERPSHDFGVDAIQVLADDTHHQELQAEEQRKGQHDARPSEDRMAR